MAYQTEDDSLNFKKNGAYLQIEDTRGNGIPNISGDGKKLKFKAFLTSFADKFTSNWNTQEIYGRMDPLHTFQNTSRVITLGLVLPSASYKEGKENLQRISALERLMYPNYKTNGSAITITEAPVFKVQFANLISDVKTGGGLHCVIPEVSFNPNVDMGFYADPLKKFTHLVPKEISLDLTLNILHMHKLGFENKSFAAEKFPRTAADATAVGVYMVPDLPEAGHSEIVEIQVENKILKGKG